MTDKPPFPKGCVHGKQWCRPCQRGSVGDSTSRYRNVRLPYARNPNRLKPTQAQLEHISHLTTHLRRPMKTPTTKVEASDMIQTLRTAKANQEQPMTVRDSG